MGMRGQDQLSRLVDELCALVFSVLRSPPPLPAFAAPCSEEVASPLAMTAAPAPGGGRRRPQVTAAGLASLLLGASMALMLCGSVTFMIGFILMPWVLGLVMVLHFLGILSHLSALGRAILSPAPPSPKSPRRVSGQLFSKLPIM